MSKPLHEAMQDLDDAVQKLKADLWEHRYGLLAYVGTIWLVIALLLFAYGPNFLN